MTSPELERANVCLFYVNAEFLAMDARCAHSGGPLCDGDIEEADGTSISKRGNQQQVYEVKLEDGNVFVKHASELSLQPFGQVKEN
uniref:Rieske domain-containing protein n=1 Tax=Sinocyclocheilus grahami TaxID=75366 RepID=A0A672P1L0_SINGR